MTIQIRAISHVLPSRVVTNQMVADAVVAHSRHGFQGDVAVLESTLHSLFEAAGTRVRHHRDTKETALELGARAGRRSLESAGMAPSDIDLLLYVGVGRGFLEPATFNVFQDVLQLVNATGFDILDACASWMRALDLASVLASSGRYRNIMILNAEFNVRDYERLEIGAVEELEYKFPALTIGEAATATIVSAAPLEAHDEVGYFADFRSEGAAHDLCKIPLPNIAEYSNRERRADFPALKFYSYGERIFQFGFQQVIKHFRSIDTLKRARERSEAFFFHSASQPLAQRVGKVLELAGGHHTHAAFGNTVSASIPLGMSDAIEKGLLRRGMQVVLGCGSAGFSSGWCKFKYV